MGKTAKVKKIGEEVVKKRIDWKSILKKTWKIVFNTSAVAGIASAGVIGVTKLNVVPGSVKQNVAEVIQEYENPIAEALRDPNECYIDERYLIQNWGLDYLKSKFSDDEELRQNCITRAEKKIWLEFLDDIWETHRPKAKTLEEMAEYCETHSCIDGSPTEAGPCDELFMEMAVFNITTSPLYGKEDTLSRDEVVRRVKLEREYFACDMKERVDEIFSDSGIRVSYYDFASRTMVYNEEEQ